MTDSVAPDFSGLVNAGNAVFRCRVRTWEEAVRKAGELLVVRGSVTSAYIEGMVQAVKELGPYIVIAPGIALAHTQPGESVLRDDLVLATLAEPVSFGHSVNDPVTLVFALCARDAHAHILALQSLAEALLDDTYVRMLNEAENIDALNRAIDARKSDQKEISSWQ